MRWVELANGRSVAVYDDAPPPARALNVQEPTAEQEAERIECIDRAVDRAREVCGVTGAEMNRLWVLEYLDAHTTRTMHSLRGMADRALAKLYQATLYKEEVEKPKRMADIAKAIATRREWRGAEPIGEREVTGIGLCSGWRKGAAVAWVRKVA